MNNAGHLSLGTTRGVHVKNALQNFAAFDLGWWAGGLLGGWID